jgi:Protein of unknown function (DUF2946)
MARLALMAMVALTLLPGIGRIAQQTGTDTADRGLVSALGAMCTSQGLAYDPAVAVAEAAAFPLQADGEGRSPSHPHPHAGGDCDYCTIASASIVPAFLSLATPALIGDIALPSRSSHSVLWHYPRGLGSRGPPLTA